jgi:DNA (cytosine-5)-methyltransferase 1
VQEIGASQRGIPTYADLFAGCGGLSLGLEWAGFRRSASIEISPDAALTYYHNLICREELSPFSWTNLLDSRELQVSSGLIVGNVIDTLDDFITSCNVRAPHLDLLAGGSPCQGFSLAGKRDPSDPRNYLVDFFIVAIGLLCPRAVLIENVPAINAPLGSGQSRTSTLDNIVRKLESHHYVASIFRLESSKVGVPQKRIRLFILGILEPLFEKLPVKYKLLWPVENGVVKLIEATGRATLPGLYGGLLTAVRALTSRQITTGCLNTCLPWRKWPGNRV